VLAFVLEVQATELVPLWSRHSWRRVSQTGYSCRPKTGRGLLVPDPCLSYIQSCWQPAGLAAPLPEGSSGHCLSRSPRWDQLGSSRACRQRAVSGGGQFS
jgi:hypothetical protein